MTDNTTDVAPLFVPYVQSGFVVLSAATAATITALKPVMEVDGDGKPINQDGYDAAIGLLKASGGIAPASLSATGDGYDTVMELYSRDWAKGEGSGLFDVYLSSWLSFTDERKKAYRLSYLALADRDDAGDLVLRGHSFKAPSASMWKADEGRSHLRSVSFKPATYLEDEDGKTTDVIKSKARWDFTIEETNPDAVETFVSVEGQLHDARAKLVAFLTEREDGAVVVELMKRAKLTKGGFKIEAPPAIQTAVRQAVRTGRGTKMTASITFMNGDVVSITGSSSQIGLAAAKGAIERDPNVKISKTDRFYNPTGKNTEIPRGYAGSWISGERGALARCAAGEAYTRPWLKDVQIALA